MSHKWFIGVGIILLVMIFTMSITPFICRQMSKQQPASSNSTHQQQDTDEIDTKTTTNTDGNDAANSQNNTATHSIANGKDTTVFRISDEENKAMVPPRTDEKWKTVGDGLTLVEPEPKKVELGDEVLTQILYPLISEIAETAHHGANFAALPTTDTTTITATTNTATVTHKHRKHKSKTATAVQEFPAESPDLEAPPNIWTGGNLTKNFNATASNNILTRGKALQKPVKSSSDETLAVDSSKSGKQLLFKMPEKADGFGRIQGPAKESNKNLSESLTNEQKQNEFDAHLGRENEPPERSGEYDSLRKISQQNFTDSGRSKVANKSGKISAAPKLMHIKTSSRTSFFNFKTPSLSTPTTVAPTTTADPETSGSVDLLSGSNGYIKGMKISPSNSITTTTQTERIKVPIKVTVRLLEKVTSTTSGKFASPKIKVIPLKSPVAKKYEHGAIVPLTVATISRTVTTTSTSPSTTSTRRGATTILATTPPTIKPSTSATAVTSNTRIKQVSLPFQDSESEAGTGESDYEEEAEDEEDDYVYEDIFLYIRPVATTTTTATPPSPTTTTTKIASTTSIKKVTPVPQHPHRHSQHHHDRHEQQYDNRSPVIVTALFDIGRGKWPKYTRTYEQYMSYLEYLLRLRNRLVIYTDSRGADFVRQKRNTYNTQIFEMSVRDLPLYRFREEMEGIIRKEQKEWQFDPRTRDHPEANSADYDIIVNSKPYFLYNATQSSRFRTSDPIFAWIDAGYGHGRNGVIPANCNWRPQLRRDRMTIIKVTPAHDKVSRYSITDLYRVDWNVVSGGFIAGDSYTINRFYRFFHKTFMDLLDSGRVDDDQAVSLHLPPLYMMRPFRQTYTVGNLAMNVFLERADHRERKQLAVKRLLHTRTTYAKACQMIASFY